MANAARSGAPAVGQGLVPCRPAPAVAPPCRNRGASAPRRGTSPGWQPQNHPDGALEKLVVAAAMAQHSRYGGTDDVRDSPPHQRLPHGRRAPAGPALVGPHSPKLTEPAAARIRVGAASRLAASRGTLVPSRASAAACGRVRRGRLGKAPPSASAISGTSSARGRARGAASSGRAPCRRGAAWAAPSTGQAARAAGCAAGRGRGSG
jgi:hypothetical protein